ncbi:hypothetical protein [Actinoplanes sichuanensis]|uniref:Uncharacterized protein n=1 Tax=Actinoplanes sichuanensis TaxID=512349 RepID=A0ABW4A5D5_9ACTN|nr:hypothetical protein [Actinoplanes sichuanensis]
MTDWDEVVGHWDHGPFAYGSMETTELVLLPDGTGWGLWAGAAGGQDLVVFEWRRSGPDRLAITETLLASGTWDSARPGQIICAEPPQPADERQEFRYGLTTEVPPLGDGPVPTLTLDEAFLFARRFALVSRDVTTVDRPKVVID